MPLLTKGNLKLSKKVAIFNLPAGITCPGATKFCAKVCYAKKAQRNYPAVTPSRMKHLELTKQKDFVDIMVKEITKSKCPMVRIHESGDMYSQEYLDKWKAIATGMPKISFLAYTKSFDLDFEGIPKNFKLYFSLDPTSDKVRASEDSVFSFIVPKGEKSPKGFYECSTVDTKTGHTQYCGDSCKICWKGKRNVAFAQH